MADVVIVGVDGSDAGTRAAEFAAQRTRDSGARLVVTHVIPYSPYTVTTPEEHDYRHVAKEKELAAAHQEIVDPLVERLRSQGVDAEALVRHGHHPAQTLCEIADESQATQIFVGRHGHSRLRTMLFHTTSSNVTQLSTVPVTVVP